MSGPSACYKLNFCPGLLHRQAIVRLILDRNDQQASIFLQQKLKNCNDATRRSHIIDSILPYAFDLITNRVGPGRRLIPLHSLADAVSPITVPPCCQSQFGNFIVSRCLDLGNDMQRRVVTGTMQSNIASMACDTYGSHVVQKALDLVDDFDSVVVAE